MSNVENVAAVFNEEGAGAKPIEGVYGPIAPGARLTYAWATPIAQIAMYFVSVAPAIIVVAIVMAPLMMAGGVETMPTDGTLPADIELPALVIALAVQFPAWALFVVLWTKGFERRSLASAGFRGPNVLRQYGIGLAAGLGIALLLALLSPVVEPSAAVEAETLDFARVLAPDWLLVLSGVLVLFLVQGACEEIAFRGWMLSSVAARRGVWLGVVLNIVTFGMLHVHVFASGVVAGSVAILALTCVGLFMSFWAIAERSVVGVCGVHGAFNATIVILGMAVAGAADPSATPGQVLLQTIREATALEGDASTAGALLQLVIFAGLSFLIWRWLTARRPEFR